jgi:hypothetical protein
MATQRDVLFITTQRNEALQQRLASQSTPLTPAVADVLGIEVFTHTYDPEAFRAWLLRAVNPIVGGRPALEQSPRSRANGLPAGGTTDNRTRILRFLGVTDGMSVDAARSRLTGGIAQAWDPIDTADARAMLAALPASGTVALAVLATAAPPRNRSEALARFIGSLSAAEQTDVVSQQFLSLSRAVRAVNITTIAFDKLRALCERAWGFYARGSDSYMDGISSDLIRDRMQTQQPPPYNTGDWRRQLSADWNARYGQRYGTFGPGDVLFGLERDYNTSTIGCRDADNPSVNPSTCQAPTGECHRLWWQFDASVRGGLLYTPMQMAEAIQDVGPFDPYVRVSPDQPHFRWDAPLYESHRSTAARWRLYALPPLRWYWELYFAPQPEFGGRSFAEWLLAQNPRDLIRATRRENTMANEATAAYYQTLVTALIGQAQVDAVNQQRSNERENQAIQQTVMQVGGATATGLATIPAVGPVAGLIAGIATTASVLALRALQSNTPTVHVDVYGQMEPTFRWFAIRDSQRAFDSDFATRVGMPQGAVSDLAPEGTGGTLVLTAIPAQIFTSGPLDLVAQGVNLGSLTGASPSTAIQPLVTGTPLVLKADGPLAGEPQGMSTGAKVAAVVALVVGGGAYAWHRSKKRKSNGQRARRARRNRKRRVS